MLTRRNATRSGENTSARGVREVLFVQGAGAGTHDSWDNKLVASLEAALGAGYEVRYPRMPDEANPDDVAWKKAIAQELRTLGTGAVLVGHSAGAAVVLDLLADGGETVRGLGGVFLIATPFLGDGGWPNGDLRPTREVAPRLPDDVPLHLYQGDEDDTVPLAHFQLFEQLLPRASFHRLAGRDHQLDEDLSDVARDIHLHA